jgi:phosphate transport system substrate-binding protein
VVIAGIGRSASAIVLALAALLSGSVFAQQHAATVGPPGPTVEWVEPAVPASQPPTDAQKEEAKKHGRALPEAEILQPTLDAQLPAYRPCQGRAVSGDFTGAVSDVLPGLATLWIERFNQYCPGVKIRIAPPYAGSLGATELLKQSLDFVFVSRELRPDDIKGFKEKFGYEPLSVPVSGGSYRHFGFLDAVGFVVNKDNPLERLTFQQLDAILSTTRHRGASPVTVWGQLGLTTGEWADKPIHVYAIKPWNGFEEFIRQRVLSTPGLRGEWRTDLSYDEVVFPIAGHVAQDRYGIGYTGLAYVDSAVKVIDLSERDGGPFYSPSYENVARAVYPLSRLVYFNTNRAPGKPLQPGLAEFLRFILSSGGQQAVLDQRIYVPLRASQAARARALLD